MLFVLDAPAIIAVGWEADDPDAAFDALTDVVQDGEACFADQVLDELGRLARRGTPYMWAGAVAGSGCPRGAAYNYLQWVVHDFSSVADLTSSQSQESAAAYVAAQALEV